VKSFVNPFLKLFNVADISNRLSGLANHMQKGKNRRSQERDILPESFDSIADAAAFWESHDSADYEDLMEEVDFEIDVKRHI